MLGYVASFTNVVAIATSNVFGGKASTLRDWRVTFRYTSSIILVISLVLAFFDKAAFQGGDFLIGLLAGISGGLGIPLAYKSFATGPVAYVSPLLSIVQTTALVIFAIVLGETLGLILVVALILGVIGVYLSGKPKVLNASNLLGVSKTTIAAGLFFSGFAIGMTQLSQGQSITGLTGARTGVFLVAFAIVRSRSPKTDRKSTHSWMIFTFISALMEFTANFSYVVAVTNLDLAKVGIILSTSSIFATLIAIPVMKQRPRFINWIGILIATLSLALVALA
jgi:drug/metabolite transporter (DMT)-like permease